ncbi:MAG: alpha/beta hydrolase-fold protein [Subdoligranulum sp.]
MNSFSVEQKRVDVFESAAPNKPVIYLNTYGREGAQIFQYLTDIGCQDFSLVAVSKLEWNHDMVPWDIPPIFKNGASYTSGADEYLRLLINQIIPKAESLLQGTPAWRGIAGYSLAGLFALYSIYQTDAFSRVASVSGSLWFPGIKRVCRFPYTREKTCRYLLFAGRPGVPHPEFASKMCSAEYRIHRKILPRAGNRYDLPIKSRQSL